MGSIKNVTMFLLNYSPLVAITANLSMLNSLILLLTNSRGWSSRTIALQGHLGLWRHFQLAQQGWGLGATGLGLPLGRASAAQPRAPRRVRDRSPSTTAPGQNWAPEMALRFSVPSWKENRLNQKRCSLTCERRQPRSSSQQASVSTCL